MRSEAGVEVAATDTNFAPAELQTPLDFIVEGRLACGTVLLQNRQAPPWTLSCVPEELRAFEEGGATPTAAPTTENPGNMFMDWPSDAGSTRLITGRLFSAISLAAASVATFLGVPLDRDQITSLGWNRSRPERVLQRRV